MEKVLVSREILWIVFLFMNFLSYFLYFFDKKRAVKGKRRISEKALLLSSFLAGGLGSYLAMKQFRHKTKKLRFKWLVPMAALITLFLFIYLLTS